MKITINEKAHKIIRPFMLTGTAEKIRIKRREKLNEYGYLFATSEKEIKNTDYVEWMIGYDIIWGSSKTNKKTSQSKALKKLEETTLEKIQFDGANGYRKSFYELSEYTYYFYKWGVISRNVLKNIKNFLENISEDELICNDSEMQIERDVFQEKKIKDVIFNKTRVKYPLLVYGMNDFGCNIEIKIEENQHAVGIQPMFYLCIPISKIKTETQLIGRTVQSKEIGEIEINEKNIEMYLSCIKLFGILSPSHKHDVIAILDRILAE